MPYQQRSSFRLAAVIFALAGQPDPYLDACRGATFSNGLRIFCKGSVARFSQAGNLLDSALDRHGWVAKGQALAFLGLLAAFVMGEPQ